MRWRYDEILRQWIDALPDPARDTLRAAVLSIVVEAIKGPRTKPACATVWALAHRTVAVTEALVAVASAHDDEIGDLALRTRVHLGVPEDDRPGILAELHRRAERRWNHSLVASFEELPDRSSLDLVVSRVQSEQRSADDPGWEPFLAENTAQIPSAIADQYPQDDALQDDVWNRLMAVWAEKQVQPALIMNSTLAARVDSPHVVRTYLRLIDPNSAVRREIIYNRLEDLVRPRQLLGWDCDPDDRTLSVLRRDAQEGTAMEAAWTTRELRQKLLAWKTLLTLGRTDLSTLVGPAVEAESNGYVIGEVLDIAACMAIESLPACIPDLIAASFTRVADNDDQRLIAHIGAIRLAHSAKSEEAFGSLLKFRKG